MPVITLTTDWGTTDYFIGAVKGDLIRRCPGASLIDISHHVSQHDLLHGAFIFMNTWQHFPDGTVHIIGMSAKKAGLLAITFGGHFFLGPNDGFFSLVFDEMPELVYDVLTANGQVVQPSASILAEAAAYLVNGGVIAEMGRPVAEFVQKKHFQPIFEDNLIRGSVIYIDSFGNLVTNIKRKFFEQVGKGRKFEIGIRVKEYTLDAINLIYDEVPRGQLVAIFNSKDYLELALNQGSASGLLGIKTGDQIKVDFI